MRTVRASCMASCMFLHENESGLAPLEETTSSQIVGALTTGRGIFHSVNKIGVLFSHLFAPQRLSGD